MMLTMLWKSPKDPALTFIIFEVIWPFKRKFSSIVFLQQSLAHLCKSHVLTVPSCVHCEVVWRLSYVS